MCFALTFGAPLTVLAEDPGDASEEPVLVEESFEIAEEPEIPLEEPAAEPMAEPPAAPAEESVAEPVAEPAPPAAEEPAAEPVAPEKKAPAAEEPAAPVEEEPAAPAEEEPAAPVEEEPAAPVAEEPEAPAEEEPAAPAKEEPAAPVEEAPAEEPAAPVEEAPAEEPVAHVAETPAAPAGTAPVGGAAAKTPDPVDSPYGSGGKRNVSNANIDAEKYLEDGYDANLCWAATAANMLWEGDYAIQAINPLTKKNFESEDEVLDYFRKCFTDEPGIPDGAIRYFIDGEYPYQGEEGGSQLKKNAPAGGLLPGYLLNKNWLRTVEQSDSEDVLDFFGDMIDMTAGALLRWWEGSKFSENAHWLTVVSVDRKKGEITLADSDDDPVTKSGKRATTDAEKAKLAASMPNCHTVYSLIRSMFNGKYFWELVGFDSDPVVITFACALNDASGKGGPGDDEDDDDDDDDKDKKDKDDKDKDDKKEQQESKSDNVVIPSFADPDILSRVIKEIMVQNGTETYSATNGVFDRLTAAPFTMFVRRNATLLSNVYLDGKLLRFDQYSIKLNSNGTFAIIINSEFLRTLKDGSHSLKLNFDGRNDIDTTINIK